jgi:hypothetical protein
VALSRVSDPPGLGRRRVGVREPRGRLIGGRYTKNVTILPDLERVHHTTHHYRVVAAKYNPRQNRTENLVFMCHIHINTSAERVRPRTCTFTLLAW